MADIAPNGVWVNTRTQEVTTVRPSEGIQLVPPGGTIPDRVAQLLNPDAEVQAVEATDDVERRDDFPPISVESLGGGWYQVGDQRIRGKAEAEAAARR